MKGKAKRTQMNHTVGDYGKADRAVQKSMRKESEQSQQNYATYGFIAGVIAVFSKILKFFFNNDSSSDYTKPTFSPVLPRMVRENNSNKRWYKTHVPKSMRSGLTHLEVTQLRQKVYASRVIYV